MKNLTTICFALTFATFLFLSCSDIVNTPERNSIAFKQPINAVEDSLIVMKKLINSLPFWLSINKVYYGIDPDSNLYIDQMKFGKLYSSYKHNIKEGHLFKNEKSLKRFVDLVIYLNDNHISHAYKDVEAKVITFDYRELYLGSLAGYRGAEYRYLVFSEDIVDTNAFFKKYRLLDKKGKLSLVTLIVPKD